MEKNKVLKGLGIIGLGLIITDAVFGVINIKKAKDLHKYNDVVVTFGEEAIDMSNKASRLACGVMFGSMILDFRESVVSDEPIEIELYSKFAGVEIIVPEGWYVESKGKITMASVENFTATYEDEKPSMILNFNASFTGISIKNVRYS
jgi:hypothetical protein